MERTIMLAAFATLSSITAALYMCRRRKREIYIPLEWEPVGIVKSIFIYPLKSGYRVKLTQTECTNVGLKEVTEDGRTLHMRDRFLAVYEDGTNKVISARVQPKLVLVKIKAHTDDEVALNAPGMKTLYMKIPTITTKGAKIRMLYDEKVDAIDCGDGAARWISQYLLQKDRGLRITYNDGSNRRDLTKTHKQYLDFYNKLSNSATGLYSEMTSVHLINQVSVDDMNTRIGWPKEGEYITVNHFRPNLVIEPNVAEPYIEDDWRWIKIGDVVMKNVKESIRCSIPTIDPENGDKRSDREPLRTLEKYRISKGPVKLPVMGIELEVVKQGIIRMNDTVLVSK